MAKETIAEKVEALILPCVTELGYRLWDVEYVKEGADFILRITLDSDNGIDIDDCEKVSRAINPIIDEADPIEDFYYLEVSSPGIERVLRKPEHFAASIGEEIEVRLFAPDEEKRKSRTGTLTAYGDGVLTMTSEGSEVRIPTDKISKVQTVYDFKKDEERRNTEK